MNFYYKEFLHPNKYANTLTTRIMLINGLLSLMSYKPLDQISIKELADFSHVGRKSFYRHYKAKKDILKDCLHLLTISYINNATPPKESSSYHQILFLLNFILYARDIFDIFDEAHLKLALSESFSFFTTYYDATQDEPFFLTTSNPFLLECKYREAFISNGFLSVILLWYQGGCVESIDEIAHLCIELLQH